MTEEEESFDTGKGIAVKIGVAAVAVVVVAGLAILAMPYFSQPSQPGLASLPEAPLQEEEQEAEESGLKVDPSQYAVRQRYFEEVFRPKRDEYNLFENASAHLGIPLEEVPEYFSLRSEKEVFSELPAAAEELSEIAYLLATGKYFSIGYLDETYYKQPEFYPNFKEHGLTYWTEPDPRYWTPHGYGSYPSEQWAELKKGETEEFTAVVFFYSNWGVQTFQGVTLMQDSESKEYFDLEISPQNLLLEPSFPKFYENWAHKIIIRGRLLPETGPGEYNIGINVERPPADLRSRWEFEHKNIYFDAAAGGIKPSGDQILLRIKVE